MCISDINYPKRLTFVQQKREWKRGFLIKLKMVKSDYENEDKKSRRRN